jgi:type II secretory pathway pseudopilin PulG
MRFEARSCNTTKRGANRARAGFTLAEVLAALLFMAIVIPGAGQGLRVASLAAEVAARKTQAARVAERILNESLVTTNWNKANQNGTAFEGDRPFRWTLRDETWSQDGNLNAPHLLTVEVTYPVQSRDYVVRLSTLTPCQLPQ